MAGAGIEHRAVRRSWPAQLDLGSSECWRRIASGRRLRCGPADFWARSRAVEIAVDFFSYLFTSK
jgi:hypothetical protein